MSVQLTGADLIDLAVQTERRGERFYRDAEAATTQADAQTLFKYLGDQEVVHRKLFERLGSAIVVTEIDPTAWDEALEYIEATVDSAFFTKDAPIRRIPEGATTTEMLSLAIEFEQQTLLYFASLRDLVQPANRELVDRIIAEERSHVRRLAAMRKELGAV
jgi:rubrerythrin